MGAALLHCSLLLRVVRGNSPLSNLQTSRAFLHSRVTLLAGPIFSIGMHYWMRLAPLFKGSGIGFSEGEGESEKYCLPSE